MMIYNVCLKPQEVRLPLVLSVLCTNQESMITETGKCSPFAAGEGGIFIQSISKFVIVINKC